ncbi:hypothetical protein HDF24_21965 [Mucilaginibacter sp. X4EP1]|uniref:hypothetical protein n=1 Tax=Mucilaginibacter sp. X4EP1 TaxID=2723092 RepID=UPI00216A2873|nr:hypothetical protein [Mucilaginibacter sp. X4EP1]MCS3812347.1 hypothetical protein [Mucilaginibacter sp. X4EP1]
MDTKLRVLYLVVGTAGLIYLVYFMVTTFPNTDPAKVLVITIPDMLFFFLAYRTYPETNPRVITKRNVVRKEHMVVMQESRVTING